MTHKNRVATFMWKYKNSPVQIKASIWYTICNLLQKGISFIVIPIYVRVLTIEEYGMYTVFQSWRDVIIIFATLNLYCGIFTKAMVDYVDDRDRYTSSMQTLGTIVTAGFLLIYLMAKNQWNLWIGLDTTTMLLMFLYFMFYPAFSFWSVRQKVEYKYIKMIVVTLLVSVATPVLSLLIFYFTDLREQAVIWGYLIIQCAVGFAFYTYHFSKGRVLYVAEYWKMALKFNIPLIPHYLSLIVLGQSDRIMIDKICGSTEAGIYSLAYQISVLMNILLGAISGSLVPWSYEQLKLKQYKQLRNISNFLCIAMSVMTFGIILIAPEIIKIMGTEEYYAAVWIVPAVAVGIYFTFCCKLFTTVEFYYGSTKFVMAASLIGAILNIILNAVFIPLYGFISAGYTTMFCYFIFMITHYIFMEKICKKHKLNEKVYNIRLIALSCVSVSLLAGVAILLYNGIILRCIVVLLILLVAYHQRNKLLHILRSLK